MVVRRPSARPDSVQWVVGRAVGVPVRQARVWTLTAPPSGHGVYFRTGASVHSGLYSDGDYFQFGARALIWSTSSHSVLPDSFNVQQGSAPYGDSVDMGEWSTIGHGRRSGSRRDTGGRSDEKARNAFLGRLLGKSGKRFWLV